MQHWSQVLEAGEALQRRRVREKLLCAHNTKRACSVSDRWLFQGQLCVRVNSKSFSERMSPCSGGFQVLCLTGELKTSFSERLSPCSGGSQLENWTPHILTYMQEKVKILVYNVQLHRLQSTFNTSGHGIEKMIKNAKAALWTDPQGFLTSTNYSLHAWFQEYFCYFCFSIGKGKGSGFVLWQTKIEWQHLRAQNCLHIAFLPAVLFVSKELKSLKCKYTLEYFMNLLVWKNGCISVAAGKSRYFTQMAYFKVNKSFFWPTSTPNPTLYK